jgi:hypothetical protein
MYNNLVPISFQKERKKFHITNYRRGRQADRLVHVSTYIYVQSHQDYWSKN